MQNVDKITCGVSCILNILAEGGNAAFETAEVATGAVAAKRLGQAGLKKLAKSGGKELVEHGTDDAVRALAHKADDLLEESGEGVCKGGACVEAGINCFTAGTLVEMCDGTFEPIEQLEVEDQVLSRDPDTGEEACQPVVGLKVTPEQSVLSVELTAADGATVSYRVTPTHPFRVVGQGWKAAGALAPGDEVFTSHGGWLKVTGATWLQARQTVYNFEVARFHTYFVGKSGAWVHNNCDITPATPSADIQQALEDIESGTTRHNVRNPKPFANDGRGGTNMLPEHDAAGNSITYTEHTVNPRPAAGRLDGKRIITGSDGSTYWTDDHFSSFHSFPEAK